MTVRYPSNITLIEKEFRHIITDLRDGDGSGLMSSLSFQRYTIVFVDGGKLRITERISKGSIDYSYYDWEQSEGRIIKFHSEPHPNDPKYQTLTEPHHIHPPAEAKLHNQTRYSNFYHQELPAILELIFIHIMSQKTL